ncbi:ATP-binding protein [Candidatus Woesearchaeota archaeon]|nr:ATP-binding protein [Candidatus Woesearchaeota archaeon]
MEISALLKTINPWWKEKTISKELTKSYRRKVFNEITSLLSYRQILLLSGLRRVGKSTLIFQVINELLKNKNPEHIIYFSFDLDVESITSILNGYKQVTNIEWEKEKIFVFLDEIQKHKEWQNELKLIYDSFPNIKFIISGSSSAILEKEAMSSLVGRYFLINVLPLSFIEFIELKNLKFDLNKKELWKEDIKKEFSEYLRKSFPELVEWNEDILIKKYIKESVIDKVIKSDLPERFKDISEDLLVKLIEIFYSEPGMYINYDNLSSDLKISKKTLVKHVFYLEFAYLIIKIKNFRGKQLTSSRKLQRIYPYHWNLMYPFGWNNLYECFAANILNAKNYWRENKREVDFILFGKNLIPIEVKSANIKKEDLINLIYFCKVNKLKQAFIICENEDKIEKIEDITVTYIPLWRLALEPEILQIK